MPNFSSITLQGHLGRNPDIRQVGENKVASFSIAVTEKVKGEEVTSWYDCSVWNKQADVIEKYVQKGDALLVQGRPRIETYTGKDGTIKTKVSVRVNEFTLPAKRDGAEPMAKSEVHMKQAEKFQGAKADDQEIPF